MLKSFKNLTYKRNGLKLMKYNFDEVIDRKNTASVKWMGKENELPMWVADMDFKAAPEIIEALKKRVEHGVFGYTHITDEWKDAICGWWNRRYNFKMKQDWLLFAAGVVPIVSCAIKMLAKPGDNIALLSPNYNCFFRTIEANGCTALESRMVYDGTSYSVDYADLEEKIKVSKAFIICNPHNPIGRVWTKDELAKMGELCKKHGVAVISDEIHCDLTAPGVSYTPFMGASDAKTIMCGAPSKTFNIAGLHTSFAAVSDPELRERLGLEMFNAEVTGANVFAVTAAVTAYNDCEDWLDELREYVHENKEIVSKFISENNLKLKVVPSQATYLMWLDFSAYTDDSKAFAAKIREKTGLWMSDGAQYRGDGNKFMRFNVACPKALLLDGLNRLKSALS